MDIFPYKSYNRSSIQTCSRRALLPSTPPRSFVVNDLPAEIIGHISSYLDGYSVLYLVMVGNRDLNTKLYKTFSSFQITRTSTPICGKHIPHSCVCISSKRHDCGFNSLYRFTALRAIKIKTISCKWFWKHGGVKNFPPTIRKLVLQMPPNLDKWISRIDMQSLVRCKQLETFHVWMWATSEEVSSGAVVSPNYRRCILSISPTIKECKINLFDILNMDDEARWNHLESISTLTAALASHRLPGTLTSLTLRSQCGLKIPDLSHMTNLANLSISDLCLHGYHISPSSLAEPPITFPSSLTSLYLEIEEVLWIQNLCDLVHLKILQVEVKQSNCEVDLRRLPRSLRNFSYVGRRTQKLLVDMETIEMKEMRLSDVDVSGKDISKLPRALHRLDLKIVELDLEGMQSLPPRLEILSIETTCFRYNDDWVTFLPSHIKYLIVQTDFGSTFYQNLPPSVTYLRLDQDSIDAQNLEKISDKVKILSLRNWEEMKIIPALMALSDNKKVRVVRLSNQTITKEVLRSIPKHVTRVHLNGAESVDKNGLKELPQELKYLEISLEQGILMDKKLAKSLPRGLTTLASHRMLLPKKYTMNDIEKIQKALPEWLDLSAVRWFTEDGMPAAFPKCDNKTKIQKKKSRLGKFWSSF